MSSESLPEPALRIDRAKIPQHVAIIMDGNGRWAKQRGWHRTLGHAKGAMRVKEIIREADNLGVKILTLYAFSTENWTRPADEISVLMEIMRDYLISERQNLLENGIQVRTLGQIERLPESLRSIVQETIEITRHGSGLILNFCMSYGGRAELVRAAQTLARDVSEGRLAVADICEKSIAERLYTHGLCDPDLVIRTSGEFRVSNFLLWQLAYSEFYITETLWPDFEPHHLQAAVEAYSSRKRRFGHSDEPRRTPGEA